MSLKLGMKIGVEGRYKARVHDGKGNTRVETAFGKNLYTNIAFDYFFVASRSAVNFGPYQMMVCGPDNTPPTTGDAVMGDAFNYASEFTSSVVTSTNLDPLLGPIHRTITHTRTFPPGSLGGSPVTVAKGGIIAPVQATPNVAQVRAAPLLSAGLLVDNLGNPTTVSVLPSEYLELVWESTEYYTYDLADTFNLDINGVPTPIDITVRPANAFSEASPAAFNWGALNTSNYGNVDPTFNARNGIRIGTGSGNPYIGYLASGLSSISSYTFPTSPSGADRIANIAVIDTYVPGSKQLTIKLSWAPARANASPGINLLVFPLGAGGTGGVFQILFDPMITKTSSQQLELDVVISMDNV